MRVCQLPYEFWRTLLPVVAKLDGRRVPVQAYIGQEVRR